MIVVSKTYVTNLDTDEVEEHIHAIVSPDVNFADLATLMFQLQKRLDMDRASIYYFTEAMCQVKEKPMEESEDDFFD